MSIQVVGDHFLCVLLPDEPQKKGSLILPSNAQKGQRRCRVEVIGPEVKSIKVGDIVFLPFYGGNDVCIDNIIYSNHPEHEILAILPKE